MHNVDLSDKSNWSIENLNILADLFGYEENQLFSIAVESYISEIVIPANVTIFLQARAKKYFTDFTPPLTKIKRVTPTNGL